MSKLIRMVAACSAMASPLLGVAARGGVGRSLHNRKARWHAWIYC
jgi:hypothetical protein